MRIGLVFLAISLLLGFSTSSAYAEGDVTEGEKLAREICSRCHNVEPGGPFKEYPPSLASIAVFRTAEDIRWKIMAPPLHSGMPRLVELFFISPDNIDDVIAYIASLEE